MSFDLKRTLTDRLEQFSPALLDDDALRPASVAIVVVTGAGDPSILLTLRPDRMGRHAGQYALPGGKVDPGETARQAAFRELDEELGLDLDATALLGQLDDYPTRSGFRIRPFVLWGGEDPALVPAPDEVAQVFHIPFNELDSTALPVFEPGETEERPVLCSEFPTLGTRMYAPTAAVIYQFREVCLRGKATRVSHYDQPKFAWK